MNDSRGSFWEKMWQKDSDTIWLIILTKDCDRILLLKRRIKQDFGKKSDIIQIWLRVNHVIVSDSIKVQPSDSQVLQPMH